MRAKAEAVLGALLVIRNRAVHLTVGLMFAVLVLLSVHGPERLPAAYRPVAALTITGTLAAVAGSRVLAPGAALAAARQVAMLWWLVPMGRFTGALLVVLPCTLVPSLVLDPAAPSPASFAATVAVYAAATTSFAGFLAPLIGSSASLLAGLATVWIGGLPPQEWAFFRGLIQRVWELLPLQWHAREMLAGEGLANLFVLLGWITIGVVAAGWSTTAVWDTRPREARTSR